MRLPDGTEHTGAKFEGLDLSQANLTDYSFEDCEFVKCNLNQAILTRARFLGCSFQECDLSNAQLASARFRDPLFIQCKLLGWSFHQLEDLVNPRFESSKLNYSNLSGLKIKKTVFRDCELREVDFSGADASECDFGGSDLSGARFARSKLINSDFTRAIRYQIHPADNQIKGARFSLPDVLGLLTGLGIKIV